jgi:transposase
MMIGGLRLPKQVPAVLRYETKLGEYAQIDWGGYHAVLDGSVRKVPVFVMVLGYLVPLISSNQQKFAG